MQVLLDRVYEDVDKFVQLQECETCQRASRTLKKVAKLQSIHIEPKFWARIGVDLIGPLTKTCRGNQ